MTTSEAVHEIAAALAKAQAKLRPASKDAVNPAFRSKYADLAAVTEAAKVYAAEGIAIVQDAQTSEAGVSVATRLLHTSGQWIEVGPLTVPVSKRDAHGIGSATSYAKRYSLSAAGLIVAGDEDDDGNAASVPTGPKAIAQQAPPAGFQDWLDDLTIVAADGSEALKSAWTKSQPKFRQFLTDTAPATWEGLKATASKVKVTA